MKPEHCRVIYERDRLIERLADIDQYMLTQQFEKMNTTDKGLLLDQGNAMQDYLKILNIRISKFPKNKRTEPNSIDSADKNAIRRTLDELTIKCSNLTDSINRVYGI